MYQTGIFELREMLRHGSLSYRKHLVDVAEETLSSMRKEIEDCNARWMPHSLCKPRKSLLFRCYLYLSHSFICLVFAKLQTITETTKYDVIILEFSKKL